jgi:hypothetical protein
MSRQLSILKYIPKSKRRHAEEEEYQGETLSDSANMETIDECPVSPEEIAEPESDQTQAEAVELEQHEFQANYSANEPVDPNHPTLSVDASCLDDIAVTLKCPPCQH